MKQMRIAGEKPGLHETGENPHALPGTVADRQREPGKQRGRAHRKEGCDRGNSAEYGEAYSAHETLEADGGEDERQDHENVASDEIVALEHTACSAVRFTVRQRLSFCLDFGFGMSHKLQVAPNQVR